MKKNNLVLLFIINIVYCSFSIAAPDILTVTFLYVGQGDGMVLKMPNGKVAVIDGGPDNEEYGYTDAGKIFMAPFLNEMKVTELAAAIGTHAHRDHIGGLRYLLRTFSTLQYHDPGIPYEATVHQDLKNILKERKIKYIPLREGDTIPLDFRVRLEVLSPANEKFSNPNLNETSLVIKLTYNQFTVLFTADIGEETETKLVNKYGIKLQSRVLKAGHHGSGKSSTTYFLKVVLPEIIVVSCGKHNRYKYPNKGMLSRVKERKVNLYRTDQDGNVSLNSDGINYQINTEY